MNHARELCDRDTNGYDHVEAKALFSCNNKVFVNFIPIADITQIHENFTNFF